jgi:cation:H+ antiporter
LVSRFLTDPPLRAQVAVLAAAAAAVAFAGTLLAGVVDVFAGARFVGGATSLPGIIASVSTAAQRHPGLAIGNALDGLTMQTIFLAVADLFCRRAKLEHAAASTVGLAQGTLLVALLALSMLAANGPEVTLLGFHPVTPLLFSACGAGRWLLTAIREYPMWSPVMTPATQAEEVGGDNGVGNERTEKGEDLAVGPYRDNPTGRLCLLFALYAGITGAAGYAVGEASIALVGKTGLSETVVGTVFIAATNSLPELVTAVAAVCAGAVSLAVGDVISGNAFEVLFLAAADVAYRDGSLYHCFEASNAFTAAMAILMTGVLLLGMLHDSVAASPALVSRAPSSSRSTPFRSLSPLSDGAPRRTCPRTGCRSGVPVVRRAPGAEMRGRSVPLGKARYTHFEPDATPPGARKARGLHLPRGTQGGTSAAAPLPPSTHSPRGRVQEVEVPLVLGQHVGNEILARVAHQIIVLPALAQEQLGPILVVTTDIHPRPVLEIDEVEECEAAGPYSVAELPLQSALCTGPQPAPVGRPLGPHAAHGPALRPAARSGAAPGPAADHARLRLLDLHPGPGGLHLHLRLRLHDAQLRLLHLHRAACSRTTMIASNALLVAASPISLR